MKWVYPEFLFALGIILIPILIHLFHFRRFKTVYFSSIAFVKSVEQQQKNPRKLKHLLILLSRVLALICLVIAFAQPYFPSSGQAVENETQILGVYLDNSFSMSRIGERGELLAHAKELATSLTEHAPRNTQYVLLTNELSGSEKQTLNFTKFTEQLAKVNYSPLVKSKKEVLTFWNTWLDEAKKEGKTIESSKLVYISDFQQFKNKESKGSFSNIQKLSPLQLKPVNAGNLFVDSIWFETPYHKLGAAQTIHIRVMNTGTEQIEKAVVSVQIGKSKRDLFADLPAAGSDTVSLNYFNQQEGIVKGLVSINDKQMNQDDSFYFNYEVKKNSKILLIQGEDAVDNVKMVYELDPFFLIKEVATTNYSTVNLEEFDLVVLNGLNQLPSNLNAALTAYAEEGGGLLLIPGANISPSGWNSFLAKLRLPQLGETQTTGLGIKKINLQDSFFEGVFEGKPENISLPEIAKAYRSSSSTSTLSIGLLNYQNGSPFFLRGTGKTEAYLFTTSLKSEFSSFTTNQLFSTLLLHVGRLVQRQNPLFLTIGSDGSFPIYHAVNTEEPIHLKNQDVDFIPNTFIKNKRSYLSVQGLEAIRQLSASTYSIVQNSKKLGLVSMNYDRIESQTSVVSTEDIKNDFAALGVEINQIQDGSSWNSASLLELGNSHELWRWFIVFAGLFLLAEMLLQIFYRN